MSKKKSDDDQPTFEESLAELDDIVAKLEGGKLPLADALAAYELGVKRLGACYKTLRDAERRIQLVRGVDSAGEVDSTPFDDDDAIDLEEKSAARSRRRTAKGGSKPGSRVDDDNGLF